MSHVTYFHAAHCVVSNSICALSSKAAKYEIFADIKFTDTLLFLAILPIFYLSFAEYESFLVVKLICEIE